MTVSEFRIRICPQRQRGPLKRLPGQIPGLKETRAVVISSQRGLEIVNRVLSESGASILEVSSRVQEVIRRRVQNELGIEEIGAIRICVARIAYGEKRRTRAGKWRAQSWTMLQVASGVEVSPRWNEGDCDVWSSSPNIVK